MKEQIIIHPAKGKKEKTVPETGLLVATAGEARLAQKLLMNNGGRQQNIYISKLAVSAEADLFAAGPTIGAPFAVMTMEKLIALGARKIILFGWCGAVTEEYSVGDVVVGGVPVSGEGTSHHYPLDSPAMPSMPLCDSLSDLLDRAGIQHSHANIWSTDAPYREERSYLAELHKNADVKCVDMEYSALCAVAQFRNVEFSALFLVSDELYRDKWQPGYVRRDFRDKSSELVALLTTIGK
ncbi:hypothetical protein [Desulfosediminicola sp.]|uniref:phosphorylase family protein n=1 Tax=Desulfosediminicola sp. TaxID=2886825 RepID=UPI003AF297D1